ncbi:molybdate ABC transporter substrate-binding protein [Marinomonas pollencensis]|uniref:Molybdate transport system substrate-binding protein n=1 Tax=Marinomonas pollencensis TaxID=491954 RepID=A0A3E0DU19_9GAMM|nr:molybdate ABC transporter substrate-binding protein [Marinomonas pollencensis]REG86930.1 molybdate transport system substrate-binding protein [Marinomonas pollencensis]
MFHPLQRRSTALFSIVLKFLTFGAFGIFSATLLAQPLRIAVASNFTAPIQKLAPIFEQETGHKVQLSFGSSGKFFAQIQHGAPFDVFLSADQAKPDKLIKNNLAIKDSKIIYAKGALALWSANLSSVTPIEATLLEAHKIAIANPKLAPYGQAAKETLNKLGLWSKLQGHLVQGENIGQTYQFTYSRNADLGFVALSQVLAGDNKGHYWKVPAQYHKDIKQAAVVLNSSQQKTTASDFLDFLMRSDIQHKIAQFGYQSATQ